MNSQTPPPPQGSEYTPCACSHIEPEHEPNAGECYSCDCAAYRPAAAAPLPPADQTTPLRDRIAAAIWARTPEAEPSPNGIVMGNPHGIADAVLAVLPTPADRAAVLREIADEIAGIDFHPNAHARSLDIAAGLARRLRRMADETATTETQAGAPGRRQTVEYFVQSQQPDGTWESASSFSTDLDFAAARLAARREKMPDLTLRLAERTTTVAVRALPDCLSCRHWSCDGTGECGALLDAWQRCDCTGPAAGARQDGARP
ncbi:hypothetical protein TR631_12580 [Streptomyces rochei]|uniref:hypothetical protein n=1 Tax=Streptomyces rochei TaxID=1928 RepID=UPI002ACEE83F|nr:hypothetical protein [Streptomyces rochei]WQC12604.1 hypothetical protein TR631_12580 [Streptomyces rochei]